MPLYEIEQLEIHIKKYRVRADSEAAAIIKLFDGEAEPVDDSLELIEICEEKGLPVEDHPELAEELRKAGVMSDEHVIPSIRSIEKVE